MNQPKDKTWVFMDAGDTFIYGYPTLYDAVRDCWKAAGGEITPGEIEARVGAFLKANPRNEFNNQQRFEDFLRMMYRYVLTELQFPGDVEQYIEVLWNEWRQAKRLRLFDDALFSIKRLKEAGFKLGIITNWDNSFHPLIKRLGVDHLFDVTVVSCIEEVAKPDKAIFELALQRAGVEPHQCWYLGDQVANDVEPANALGMTTIHVDYYGKGGGEGKADFVVNSLSLAAYIIQPGHGGFSLR